MEKARQVFALIDEELYKKDEILCEKWKEEIVRHIRIAGVMTCADKNLKAIEDDKKVVTTDASLKLHQAMVHFPTGQALVAAVDAEVNAAQKDSKMLRELGSAAARLGELEKSEDRFSELGPFVKNHQDNLADIAKKLHMVEGSSSQRFRTKNETSIREVAVALTQQFHDVMLFVESKFSEAMLVPLGLFATMLGNATVKVKAEDKQAIVKGFTALAARASK